MANENETVEQVCDAVKGDWRVLATNEDGDAIRGFTEEDMESFAQSIIAAHKREIDELKEQVRLAKNAFFNIVKCAHSQTVHDIICEAEFKMNHPECREVI